MEGTKETMDVVVLLETAAETIKAAKADGKVTLLDLPKLAPLVPAGLEALRGSELIPAELKDLSKEEAGELMAKTADAVVKLVQALFVQNV